METKYAVYYKNLYERHWWWRSREDLILATLKTLAPQGRWGSILDVGCGDGLFFGKLAALGDVEGVEMDPSGVTPDGPYRSRIHVRPFDESFQPGKRYGLITMLDVLEHFEDPLRRLRLALALLDEGGTIVITVPALQSLWTTHDELNHHFMRYSRSQLRSVAEAAGGRVLFARYVYQWLVPLKLAVRLKERLVRSEPTNPPIPGRAVNGFFYGLARVEERVTRLLPMPFGSSLIAAVRKV